MGLPMFPLEAKIEINQSKLTMSSDRFPSRNLLFVNIEYYQSASQQVTSCKATSCMSITLRVASRQGCQLRANEPASYQVNSL